MHMFLTYEYKGPQKLEALDPLELELWDMAAGSQIEVLCRSGMHSNLLIHLSGHAVLVLVLLHSLSP